MTYAKRKPLYAAATITAAALSLAAYAGAAASASITAALSTMQRGDTLYGEGRYRDAFDRYGAAMKGFEGNDPALYAEAARRAGRAFCKGQFAEARQSLATGDRQFALLQIETALSDPACREFAEDTAWAREQKRLRSKSPR